MPKRNYSDGVKKIVKTKMTTEFLMEEDVEAGEGEVKEEGEKEEEKEAEGGEE